MAELQAMLPGRVAQIWEDTDNAQVVIEPLGAAFTPGEQTTINTAIPTHAGPITQAERDAANRAGLRTFLGI